MTYSVAVCRHCLVASTAYDHSTCPFIDDLATMRGITFEEARAQYAEQNLIEFTEMKMVRGTAFEPAPASPMFETAEEKAFLAEPDEEIAPALLDRLGLKRWLQR